MSRKKTGPVLSVRTFIEDDDENILVLRRNEDQLEGGKWSFPGGHLEQYEQVKESESPEEGVARLVSQRTGLDVEGLDFLNYQNSLPSYGSELHCLNMYFKAKGNGQVTVGDNFSDYAWIPLDQLETIDLAFDGKDAIGFYRQSMNPEQVQLWKLVDEAGSRKIPITKEMLLKLNIQPGFFDKMERDISVYELVRKKVHTTLEMIRSCSKRNSEPIINQIESRTKSYDSTLEKMIRKGDGNIPRHYTTFDDMAGARSVVTFLKDVYTVRDRLQEYPDFSLREEEDYIKEPKDTGYRALHLTLEVPLPGLKFVPRCEVQIKTLYQHSWSNMTHELTYKQHDISEEHLKKFLDLSRTLTAADEIAEKLRHDVEHRHRLEIK